MDKAEQPTTQALKPCPVVEAIAQEIADRSPWKKTTDNYARIYQAAYAGAIAALNTRTTSLAAQDDWTTKRVAELVAEGYGHWRSCTGCHETNEGAETGDYPFNPVFKTYQGGGCGECGGIGVVWDDIDYADYAEFCLNADDDAPSLAAQDDVTLVEELRAEISNLEAALTQIAGSHWERYGIDQTDIEDVPDLSAEEAMNVARDALSNTPAPSPPAQDGLVEAAEGLLNWHDRGLHRDTIGSEVVADNLRKALSARVETLEAALRRCVKGETQA